MIIPRPNFTRLTERQIGSEQSTDSPVIQGESVWAHASGWAQLSGTKHSISCVVVGRDQVRNLRDLIPALSDILTECGYPWELLLVDHGSIDGTADVLANWTELPGFRSIQMGRAAARSAGVSAGLALARGDAIVLYDASAVHAPELIRGMIMRWEDGAWLVVASANRPGERPELSFWDEAMAKRRLEAGDPQLPSGFADLSLLDRRLLNRLTAT